MTDPAFEAHLARKKFYEGIEDSRDRKLDAFIVSVCALASGYDLGNTITIANETPRDMDGIVLKVTIT
jgi:hypothetical protein